MSGMDIKTGQQVSGPASTSSERAPVAPPTQRYPSRAIPDAGPVADTVGMQRERLSTGRAAVAAAQSQAHTADGERRGGYESAMLPLGASYGDQIVLPEVPAYSMPPPPVAGYVNPGDEPVDAG
jgi:hypothetical protein